MTRSEQINELAGALAKAQGTMAGAKKDSVNPHFRSNYADLASVWDACRDPLTANGLSVVQSPRLVSAGENAWIVEVETTLLHTSGQFLADAVAVPVTKPDAQGVGSAITYARRYSLSAFVGVAPEDDDGNAASQPQANGHTSAPAPSRPAPAAGAGRTLIGTVAEVKTLPGKSKSTGKPYVKFVVCTTDGGKYNTFDRDAADLATSAAKSGASVELTVKDSQFGTDLMGIALATGQPMSDEDASLLETVPF